ncbi:hypothetical protein B0T19DRAFT_235648 [Cercophora scortea]|uniref:NDT80 domain-containing protein n=1 Tax=Cercophora scortea TaxID=314031 RepID=A0AAE0M9S9_9PEZI|nr:hypothetical protein B0T19DRAFT_235648 [Cercophora scortea]
MTPGHPDTRTPHTWALAGAYNCSSSTSGPGMAHAPRSTALPHPGSHISARDLYSSATPNFRRPDHHIPRSPSFPGIRRHPLSPTPSPAAYNSLKMDGSYGSKTQQNIPPLNPMTPLGVLSYTDTQTPIKVEINGLIDKGFFLADDNWTCYRRNYFSCVCSYSLSPAPPSFPGNQPMQFVQSGTQQAYPVYGFAMCISAVVADNDSQAIELVQHTPKRDKGPIAKPEKVRLTPKPPQQAHHALSSIYGAPDGGLGSSRAYDQGYGQQQGSAPSEHTFERIQFKQATANNGKRRAAQQYYHLVIELYIDTASQGADPWVKIAYRKSAKMIVRGRSPGHYQSERRGSTSSGPGGSGSGSISGGAYPNMMGPADYSSGSSMLQGGYNSYEPRSSYGSRHHHEQHTMEPLMSSDEIKVLPASKGGYSYFPATLYEGEADPRHQVEMFSHSRGELENSTVPSITSGYDPTRVKTELDNHLPSMLHPGPSYLSQSCGRLEAKTASKGYYPTYVPPSSTMNMT